MGCAVEVDEESLSCRHLRSTDVRGVVGTEYHESLSPVPLGPCVAYNSGHRCGAFHTGSGPGVYSHDGWCACLANAGLAVEHAVGCGCAEWEASIDDESHNETATSLSCMREGSLSFRSVVCPGCGCAEHRSWSVEFYAGVGSSECCGGVSWSMCCGSPASNGTTVDSTVAR